MITRLIQILISFSICFSLLADEASGAVSVETGTRDVRLSSSPRPLSRARTEIEVRRLRQLASARKIDADTLIKAMRDLSGLTSSK